MVKGPKELDKPRDIRINSANWRQLKSGTLGGCRYRKEYHGQHTSQKIMRTRKGHTIEESLRGGIKRMKALQRQKSNDGSGT